LIALWFAYWGFYIHRNELQVEIGYMKQVFLVWLFCVVGAILIQNLARVTRPGSGQRWVTRA